MSWDLMYDVEEFKLASKGWHIVKVKSATIKAQDTVKNPDSKNDKNYVVEMVVAEGSDDDGATFTKYFAHITESGFTLKQLGALLVCAGVVKPDAIKGPEFFDTPAFETNFQMKLPEKLLGVFVDHRQGSQKSKEGKDVFFADVKKFRTIKQAQDEMKKAKSANGGVKNETAATIPQSQPATQSQPSPAPATDPSQSVSDGWD